MGKTKTQLAKMWIQIRKTKSKTRKDGSNKRDGYRAIALKQHPLP